jgi:hypothetical protein
MGIGPVFLDFLKLVAIGAGAVLALFLVIQVRMPKSSIIVVPRRPSH